MRTNIHIDLTTSQYCTFGEALYRFWYFSKLRELAPNLSGYPHNGGEHSTRISGSEEDCRAFLELFVEQFPTTKPVIDRLIQELDSTPATRFILKRIARVEIEAGFEARP